MAPNNNTLISTLITSILLLSWAIYAYTTEKPQTAEETYDDSQDIIEMTQRLLSKKIRNTGGEKITQTDTRTEARQKTNKTRNITTPIQYIECTKNSDCGINGTYITNNYKCYDQDIYRQYIQYRCEKPNTTDSRCVGTVRHEFIESCETDEKCVEGDSYCAYEGGLELRQMQYVLPNSTTIYVNNKEKTEYKDYKFQTVYVISENRKPVGLTIDVVRKDGSEEWVYIKFERSIVLDNMTIGIKTIEKSRGNIEANLWIKEKSN